MAANEDSVALHFGRNLRVSRKRAGMAQEELARRASLHRTEIGSLEGGARVPRIDTLIKLASALSIPPGELLAGIDWKLDGARVGGFVLQTAGEAGEA